MTEAITLSVREWPPAQVVQSASHLAPFLHTPRLTLPVIHTVLPQKLSYTQYCHKNCHTLNIATKLLILKDILSFLLLYKLIQL